MYLKIQIRNTFYPILSHLFKNNKKYYFILGTGPGSKILDERKRIVLKNSVHP